MCVCVCCDIMDIQEPGNDGTNGGGPDSTSPRATPNNHLVSAAAEQTLERQVRHVVWRTWWEFLNTPDVPSPETPTTMTRTQWSSDEKARVLKTYQMLIRTGSNFDVVTAPTMEMFVCTGALYEVLWMIHVRKTAAKRPSEPGSAIYKMLELANTDAVDFVLKGIHKLRREYDMQRHRNTQLRRGQWTRLHAERLFYVSQFALLASYGFTEAFWFEIAGSGKSMYESTVFTDLLLGNDLHELQRWAVLNNHKGPLLTDVDQNAAATRASSPSMSSGSTAKPLASKTSSPTLPSISDPKDAGPLDFFDEEKLAATIAMATRKMKNQNRRMLSETGTLSGIKAIVFPTEGGSIVMERTTSSANFSGSSSSSSSKRGNTPTLTRVNTTNSDALPTRKKIKTVRPTPTLTRQKSLSWFKTSLERQATSAVGNSGCGNTSDEDGDYNGEPDNVGAAAVKQVALGRASVSGSSSSDTPNTTSSSNDAPMQLMYENPLVLFEFTRQLVISLDRHLITNANDIGTRGVATFIDSDARVLLDLTWLTKSQREAYRMVHATWNNYLDYKITQERPQLVGLLVNYVEFLISTKAGLQLRTAAHDLMQKRFNVDQSHWETESLVFSTTIALFDSLKRFFEAEFGRLDSDFMSNLGSEMETKNVRDWLVTLEELTKRLREVRDCLLVEFRADQTIKIVNRDTGEITTRTIGFAAPLPPRHRNASTPNVAASKLASATIVADLAVPEPALTSSPVSSVVAPTTPMPQAVPIIPLVSAATTNSSPRTPTTAAWQSVRSPRISAARANAAVIPVVIPALMVVMSAPAPMTTVASSLGQVALTKNTTPTTPVNVFGVALPTSTDEIENADSSSATDSPRGRHVF